MTGNEARDDAAGGAEDELADAPEDHTVVSPRRSGRSAHSEPEDDHTVMSARRTENDDDDHTVLSSRQASADDVDHTVLSSRRAESEDDLTIASARRREAAEEPTAAASPFAAPDPEDPTRLVVKRSRPTVPEDDRTLPGRRSASLLDDRIAGRLRAIPTPPLLTLRESVEASAPSESGVTGTEPLSTTEPAAPIRATEAETAPEHVIAPPPSDAGERAFAAQRADDLRSVERRGRRGARLTLAALTVVTVTSALGLAALAVAAVLVLG